MYSPCVECKNRYNKDYSKECDITCEYAFVLDVFKKTMQIGDGCFYCKNHHLDEFQCNDCEKEDKCMCDKKYRYYELDINKVINDNKIS